MREFFQIDAAHAGQRTEKSSGGMLNLAYWFYLVLIVFTLVSIPNRVPATGALRPTVLLVALIAVVIYFSPRIKQSSDAVRNLNLLILYIALSLPFVEWPGSVLRTGLEAFTKSIVFLYFTVYLIPDFQKFRWFLITVVGCQVFRVLEPLYLHLTAGYWGSAAYMEGGDMLERLSGAPHDIVNPNGLAFIVVTVVPMLHYLLGGSPRFVLKLIYVALLPPLIYALVLTGSRSGMIALAIVFAVIIYRSRHRTLLIVTGCVGIVVVLGSLSADLRDRYVSIFDHNSRNAATAEGRIEGWKRELTVAMSRPIVGHGLGTSREANTNIAGYAQISHNLYTEVFTELGLLGLAVYLKLLASILKVVRRAIHEAVDAVKDVGETLRGHLDFYRRCGDALLAWVIMFFVFSLASYGLSEFYWYLIGGIAACVLNLLKAELARARLADGIEHAA